jgi:hypothetical protein
MAPTSPNPTQDKSHSAPSTGDSGGCVVEIGSLVSASTAEPAMAANPIDHMLHAIRDAVRELNVSTLPRASAEL